MGKYSKFLIVSNSVQLIFITITLFIFIFILTSQHEIFPWYEPLNGVALYLLIPLIPVHLFASLITWAIEAKYFNENKSVKISLPLTIVQFTVLALAGFGINTIFTIFFVIGIFTVISLGVISIINIVKVLKFRVAY